jgi:hypothetical protein
MPLYQLLSDVMVQGTPRSYGEVLDLPIADGNLLCGLNRARPVSASEDLPAEVEEQVEPSPATDDVEPQVKPPVRRRTTSTSTSV